MYLKTLNAFYSVWLNTLKFEFCYQGFTHCTDPSIFKSLISKKWGTKCCLHNWVEHSFFPKDDSKIINFEEGVLILTLILILILKRQFFEAICHLPMYVSKHLKKLLAMTSENYTFDQKSQWNSITARHWTFIVSCHTHFKLLELRVCINAHLLALFNVYKMPIGSCVFKNFKCILLSLTQYTQVWVLLSGIYTLHWPFHL